MMATMDACERGFDCCLDYDELQHDTSSRFVQWLRAADQNRLFSRIGFAGWFSYTSAAPIGAALAQLQGTPARWYVGAGIGADAFDATRCVARLDDLIQWADADSQKKGGTQVDDRRAAD